MTAAAMKILEAALALPSEEREELLASLAESLEPTSVGPEWAAELLRRVETIERGEATLLDAEAHLAELRDKY